MSSYPVQLSLFSDVNRKILSAGGFVASIKTAMRSIVSESGLSREQVVDAMNDIIRATGKGVCKGAKFISLATLEKWLGDDERGQLPDAWGLHVLILACGENMLPLKVWLEFFGCSILDEAGRDKLEYADKILNKKLNDKRLRELETKLLEKK